MDKRQARLGRFGAPLFWIVSAALVMSLAWTTYRHVTLLKVRAHSVAPYTVVRTENGYDEAGALKYVNQYVDALRSDGSQVHQVATSIENRRRIEFATGDEIQTNELLLRKSTYPKKSAGISAWRDPDASCRVAGDDRWVVEGTEVISGHPTVRHVLPGEKRKMTVWYALDAQCALVQLRFEHEDGITVQSLASLSVGEPVSALFDVASNYQEVPPSKLHGPVCKDGRCTSVPEAVQERLDKQYYALRAQSKAP